MRLLTTPYAFNEQEAIEMTKAGADIIVAHMGLTTSGSIGAKTTISLDESIIEKKKNDDEEYYESRRKIVKRVAKVKGPYLR
ncbi:Tm-1(GCR26) protein [Tanacetum coccineum]